MPQIIQNKHLSTKIVKKLPKTPYKNTLKLVVLASVISLGVGVSTGIFAKTVSKSETTQAVTKDKSLKFADYPVSVYRGKRAMPNLANLAKLGSFYLEEINQPNNVGEKKFIQSLAKTAPNYAGHYVISRFNCGANCTSSVAYDVKTGNFLELGGGFANCPATSYSNAKNVDVIHRADSKLLIVIGATNLGNCVAGYFVENKGNVNLISQKPLLVYGNATTGF